MTVAGLLKNKVLNFATLPKFYKKYLTYLNVNKIIAT